MSWSAAVTVITVDDIDDIRDLVRWMGSDGGYDVIGEATDGLGAIEQTGRLQPDVVVLNVQMPGIDGITAIPGIHTAAPRTRVLMFSAYASKKDEAMAAGADGWITKSVNWQELVDAIHAM